MNNSWWQELMRFFLQGMTLKQLIHMIIILILLIVVMPVSVKEWVNLHNPEILPQYWMYYILLFCVSYVLNGVVNSVYHVVNERIEASTAQQRKAREEKVVRDLFDSLTLGERAYLAFAVAANNQLKTEKGSPEAISLLEKGLLIRIPSATGYPDTDRFVIPESYRNECYIRFAGESDILMNELIAQDEQAKKITT
ncbi:superinfection exclusion protein B [Salmonella enterica subsp. enterica serovar Typhimurium]|uniref:Superinfection exclusion protein B n=14 Tax=Salmonella enterica TaxID=28901 RepID=A0A615FYY3_SALDE|nr:MULTISPECIES: super-infection exclusion protein B [Salmonella]YP_006376.1 superinfection exclusion; inhibits SieB [Enterobacteria phage ST104]AGK10202.1 superinfection exclusion protein B [Salmonella enterica subsp. enterica serovar Typhimurium str. U288]AGS63778.1 superinfection exclusion protein B [Salmonella enterica subsp. enterica serovar Pullorum str. S06004]AXC42635.1 superinfection exclusion protein [Salmonella phage S149]EAA3944332.1 superinfection exclusion protein B [Salmonella e